MGAGITGYLATGTSDAGPLCADITGCLLTAISTDQTNFTADLSLTTVVFQREHCLIPVRAIYSHVVLSHKPHCSVCLQICRDRDDFAPEAFNLTGG